MIKSEVESIEKSLGQERAQSVAHLSPEDRLPILKQFAALTASVVPQPGRSTTAGTPAAAPSLPDFGRMSPDEQRRWFESATPEQKKEAGRSLGFTTPQRGVWAPTYKTQ